MRVDGAGEERTPAQRDVAGARRPHRLHRRDAAVGHGHGDAGAPAGQRQRELGEQSHRRPSSILPTRDAHARRRPRRHYLMRLGFVLAGAAALPAAEFADIVRETEARGYHTAWTGETGGYDAIAVMATILAQSTRLNVGSAVVPVPPRTPTLLGMSAATLGHLAP